MLPNTNLKLKLLDRMNMMAVCVFIISPSIRDFGHWNFCSTQYVTVTVKCKIANIDSMWWWCIFISHIHIYVETDFSYGWHTFQSLLHIPLNEILGSNHQSIGCAISQRFDFCWFKLIYISVFLLTTILHAILWVLMMLQRKLGTRTNILHCIWSTLVFAWPLSNYDLNQRLFIVNET